MGREGVAFTFVSPEEGPQLTRIEQRINRQLQRDHIEDFDFSFAQPAKTDSEPQPAPPPVSDTIAKRPTKRYRRGL
jgi:ATP-dependent RNA helicase DeaD